MRVAIVSDNKIAASYLRRILVHAGNEVSISQTADNLVSPEIVILEINLPNTTIEDERKKVAFGTPVVPISAYSLQDDGRVDDFHTALVALRESKNADDYIHLIEALLGEKIT